MSKQLWFVVDNDEDEAFFIKDAIIRSSLPVEVMPVYSTMELYDKLQNITPDLVLLDVQLPEETGPECLSQLRKDQKFAHLPVVMLTTQHYPAYETEALLAGAKRFVIKPTIMKNYEEMVTYFFRNLKSDSQINAGDFVLSFDTVK